MARRLYSSDTLARLLEAGTPLIDVLGREEFDHSHIPGAVNIPLKELTREAVSRFDPSRPIVVYCDGYG
jgi:rhodanese-related sulfurtransferase